MWHFCNNHDQWRMQSLNQTEGIGVQALTPLRPRGRGMTVPCTFVCRFAEVVLGLAHLLARGAVALRRRRAGVRIAWYRARRLGA
eukprot:2837254-Prymnesium_polylepis.1